MAIFIGLVFVAYVYVWSRGGLDWDRPEDLTGVRPEPAERERELAGAR
jgi:hypothetical protein